MKGLGIVVIGRNEGERLKRCLASLPKKTPTVYVDSGSSDGSLEYARSLGVVAVELSSDQPFSAARARNEGFERLVAEAPGTAFVQFLDGDCEVVDGWIEKGLARLREDERLAAVAGQRLERYPERSWYNELCAYEWNTPIGEARAVGGDAIYRAGAFQAVGGFDPLMMAGEEPELCLRLRHEGYRIERIDADMTLHDAAIHSFGVWWKRAVRGGYAYALGMMKHGREGYRVREVVRALLWGGALPLVALVGLLSGNVLLFVVLCGLYGVKWVRIRRRVAGRLGRPGRYAAFMMLSNAAEVQGIVRAMRESMSGSRRILEYKNQPAE